MTVFSVAGAPTLGLICVKSPMGAMLSQNESPIIFPSTTGSVVDNLA